MSNRMQRMMTHSMVEDMVWDTVQYKALVSS